MPDRAQVCPHCGQGPFAERNFDDEDTWDADKVSDEAAGDPVLDAMMAIASATPKVPPLGIDLDLLSGVLDPALSSHFPPSPLALLSPLSPASGAAESPAQDSALGLAQPAPASPSTPRRLLLGVVAMTMLATLTSAQLHVNEELAGQRAPLTAPPAATVEAAPAAAEVATMPPATTVPRPAHAPDRHENATEKPAPASATSERTDLQAQETSSPATPAPAPPAALTVAEPVRAAPPSRCSGAMAALALCREP